jgi:hypothetical protein
VPLEAASSELFARVGQPIGQTPTIEIFFYHHQKGRDMTLGLLTHLPYALRLYSLFQAIFLKPKSNCFPSLFVLNVLPLLRNRTGEQPGCAGL